MGSPQRRFSVISTAMAAALLACSTPALSQVNPAEITNPRLKRAEQDYFHQLIEINRAISEIKFPFPFVLSRYAGLDPKEQRTADRRGLEFVEFEDREVLKVSGNYNAAFNPQLLTENERAERVLKDAVIPILRIIPKYFSPQAAFDGFGFEISYHVLTESRSYAYEGKEVLTIVFDRAGAFRYPDAAGDSERQGILDNCEIFVNGKNFGLMLGQREPVAVEETEKTVRGRQARSQQAEPSPPPANPDLRLAQINQELPPGFRASKPPSQPGTPGAEGSSALIGAAVTQADADKLQEKFQTQLKALETEGRQQDFFVDYAPPSFVIFRKQIYLQLTLRNPAVFDQNSTSIYKRAARSFDLFLAPRLKSLLEKMPADPVIAGLDMTVLTGFSPHAASSSEAIEYVCPLQPLGQFVDAAITNQDLINQSVVLVNGVRIALNLQQVE